MDPPQSKPFPKEKALTLAESVKTRIIEALRAYPVEELVTAAEIMYHAKERGNTTYFFGNGGSHSMATHLTCDLGKGPKPEGTPITPYRVMSLDNAAWLTAQANDGEHYFLKGGYPGAYTHGYDGVFVGQLENFIRENDVAFGISSSGNSQNVINALLFAKEKKATTIAMVGFGGGKAAQIADHVIHIPTEKGAYGIVEGAHGALHHILYEIACLENHTR